MENHIKEQLVGAFGHSDLYAILGVEKSAAQEDISKAYKRLALKYHPDRKDGDAVKFKGLSAAHSILSDSTKRDIYDRTGDCEVDEASDAEVFWYNYFRTLFPALTVEDIENFTEKYKGSEEEKNDIIEAYNQYDGDLSKMMECIMCAEVGDEERICSIIDAAITDKRLKTNNKYKQCKSKIQKGKKIKLSKHHSIVEGQGDDILDLQMQMISNRASRGNRMADIFAKYATENLEGCVDDYDVSDEAFATAQKRLLNNKAKFSQKKKSKH